jgi:formylglycine-generating enzyme required for sulfatase activity
LQYGAGVHVVPRLFLSHSSKDNVAALAFHRWLVANGWSDEDVFIDLHDINAGDRWRDTLIKANTACEAVILLASPDALDSKECQREINFAEDLGKEIIIAILRDVKKDDPRLVRWDDRQFVDLSSEPRQGMEPFEHNGQLQSVAFHLPALNSIKTALVRLGIAPGSFAWQPKAADTGPYPGLLAFGEEDAGIFFGRDAEIMAGITELRTMRKRRLPRVLVIQAASGAGKSSFLKAGLWPRLGRDPDFAPLAVLRPALGILDGPNGVGAKLATFFERHGHSKTPANINAEILQKGAPALAALLAEATEIATAVRRAGVPDARAPAPLIAIDQGEELFAAENAAEGERFLELIASALKEPTPDFDPYILLTVRADSVEALLQRWPKLGLDTPRSLYLPPLSRSAYRDVILKPAAVYSDRVARLEIEPALVDTLVQDATGADALPLLAFTLERLFRELGQDGKLSLASYEALGGTGGSIDRALAQARRAAGAAGSTEKLKRLIVPELVTWDPAAWAARRLVAREAELTGGERSDLAPLATALVDARLLTRGKGTVEVAHEALLRRPPIDGWIYERREALKLRDDVLEEAAEWVAGGKSPRDLIRRRERLREAEALLTDPMFTGALAPARDYLALCRREENASRSRSRRRQVAIYTLMLGVICALTAVVFRDFIMRQYNWYIRTELQYARASVWPHVLSPDSERLLKLGDSFRDCAPDADVCQDMIVLPKGEYWMGLPENESNGDEVPRHRVKIDYALAVGKFDVTWEAWDRCVDLGGCSKVPHDAGFGHKGYPLINVNWYEAKAYVDWLARVTGKPYRLLTEAEWEFAARGVTSPNAPHPTFPWGNDATDICKHANLADISYRTRYYEEYENCDDGYVSTSPVGAFPPNAFGLYDMHGNVWQWVEDEWHPNYQGNPPQDGSAWGGGDTSRRVIRSGSFSGGPVVLRSGNRYWSLASSRGAGFRVARPVQTP